MIETHGLTKIFKIGKGPEIPAVVDLSIEIELGEVFGFLGPNGAGKTTTVRMLASLISPTSGTARVNGYLLSEEDKAIRRSVGILTENPGLYERLSAEKNLEIFANLYNVQDVAGQVRKYLQMLELWGRRGDPVGSFSKGMRQKLAIARALLHEPPLLFLDEPTISLDPEAAQLVRSFIGELREQGRTIFLCTHNLNEADRLCDRIGIFKTRLIALDTPQNLRRRIFGRKVVFHLAAVDPSWLDFIRVLPGVHSVEQVEEKIVVGLDQPEQVNPEIIRKLVNAGGDILFVGELRHSLEEIYLETMWESEERELKA